MITAFITRAIVVSLLLACAALAAERVAAWYERSRRGIWLAAMGASLVLPLVSAWAPAVGRNTLVGRSAEIMAVFQPSRDATETYRESPRTSANAIVTPAPFDTNRALRIAWVGLSLTMFAFVALAYARLRGLRSGAAPAEIDGEAVLTADRSGPAVIGIRHPAIIVPRWVMHAPPEERRLILLHEREHIAGHDPWLLLFATLATIAMPWNIVLWWQYVRLRLAIETDCDARVLARAGNLALYGRTLIRTAGDTIALPLLVPAWGDAASQLKLRILAMTARPPRARFALATSLTVIAGAFALVACTATAGLHDAEPATPHTAAPNARASAGAAAFGLPGRGYVRVSGYTREHLRTRVVLTGSGASLEPDSGSATVHGDTLEATTPVVFRVVTSGVPRYRLVAHAVEPGTEVEIFGVAPAGAGSPRAGGARGPAPMLNFARDTLDAIPVRGVARIIDSVADRIATPAVPEPPRPPVNFESGTVRIESETGDRVSVRISSNISFRARGAGMSSNRSDGTLVILTPTTLTLTGTGPFAMVFESVDPAAGIRVSADGRAEDGQGRAYAATPARQIDVNGERGAIALWGCTKGFGVRGVARGTLAPAVKCE